MKALILAAGLGTRLQHLTADRPKALVELNGKTLLQRCIENLKSQGIEEIIVNVHHFAGKVKTFLSENDFGIRIEISDETDLLLDTGGGIKKAQWFFDNTQPFLVHNVDVISGISIKELFLTHASSGSLATLAVKQRPTNRYFLFDSKNFLSGWKNTKTGQTIIPDNRNEAFLAPFAFSGIQILNPDIFNYLSDSVPNSITDAYVRLCNSHKIKAFVHDNTWWFDLGKPENITEAAQFLITHTIEK